MPSALKKKPIEYFRAEFRNSSQLVCVVHESLSRIDPARSRPAGFSLSRSASTRRELGRKPSSNFPIKNRHPRSKTAQMINDNNSFCGRAREGPVSRTSASPHAYTHERRFHAFFGRLFFASTLISVCVCKVHELVAFERRPRRYVIADYNGVDGEIRGIRVQRECESHVWESRSGSDLACGIGILRCSKVIYDAYSIWHLMV